MDSNASCIRMSTPIGTQSKHVAIKFLEPNLLLCYSNCFLHLCLTCICIYFCILNQNLKFSDENVNVFGCQLGGIGKSIPFTLEISLWLRPREISRVSGNLLGLGDGFPNTSRVLILILLIINPSTGMDQEIHPSGQGRIDSVKSILPC